MTPTDPVLALPHRPPFLFVTGIDERCDGHCRAHWVVRGDEEFFRGHFPGDPIVPGVLIGEALAQTAGLALAGAEGVPLGESGYLVRIELRFMRPVRPPARINLEAKHEGCLGSLYRFSVKASCDGAAVASGGLVLAILGAGQAPPAAGSSASATTDATG